MTTLNLLAASLAAAATVHPPLLDGVCEPGVWNVAKALALDGGVELRLLQDRRYVYLCASLPPGSFGSTDIFIALPNGRRHNLHVSAQVGEREWTGTGWPEWRFGNQQDWYGPPVAFAGLRRPSDGLAQPRFAMAVGREVQIAKSKFGRGPWRLRLELRALGADQAGVAVFPKGSSELEPGQWAVLPVT